MAYYETEGYYSSPKDHNSEWFGKGAQELGLYKNVNPETFKSILEGEIPNSSQKLGRMVKGELQHSPATDLTFSAPKSFSILAETNNDNILHRAHQNAVKKTLKFVEKNILETRIYTDKSQKNYTNQKMVAALFRHDTNRNLDPQTHTHAVIANMVQGEDKKWRSYDNGSLYDNKLLIGAIYRSNLAQNLNRLGIEVETTHSDGRFELSHVPQELIDLFSSRSREIQAKIKKYGISSPKTIDKIALSTRKNKSKDVDRQALRSEWKNKISELGYSIKHLTLHYSRKFINPNKTREAAQHAVNFATSHLSERSAVFKEQDLKIQALGHASGKATITHIEKAYQNSLENGQLLKRKITTTKNFNYLTTPEMIRLEKNIITEHDKGRHSANQILPAFIANKYLKNTHLNQGQRDAVLLSLTSINRTIAIQGNAGTEKTTLLKQVKALAETADKHIIGLAPSGSAANTLAKETGIPSQTLSSFLKKYDGVIHDHLTDKGRKSLQEEFKNKIIILDESSFASSDQM